MFYEIPIRPREYFTFQQLYMNDVFRLQLPDISGSGSKRAPYFYRDGQVFAAARPRPQPDQHSSSAQLPTHTGIIYFNASSGGTYTVDTPIPTAKENYNRVGWVVECHFGPLPAPDPPAQLLLDSRNNNTWIYGTGLQLGEFKEDKFVPIHPPSDEDGPWLTLAYDPEEQLPCNEEMFLIKYRDGGTVACKAYKDAFFLLCRDAPQGNIPLIFGVATLANEAVLQQTRMDGVLGLGYSRADTSSREGHGKSILSEIATHRGVDKIIYCLKFHETPPNLLAVGPPPTPLPFEQWERVYITNQLWEVPFSKMGVLLNGQWNLINLSDDAGTTVNAHLDCDSSFCYVPADKLEQLYSLVGVVWEDGAWCIPKNAAIPDIGFMLGRTWLRLPGSFLRFQLRQRDKSEEWDRAAIQPHAAQSTRAVLGGSFFRHVDVYFDADSAEPRIGFDDRAARRRQS